MNEVMVREYLGNGIGFKVIDGMVYANATEMAKVFGKLPADWIRLKQTQEYVEELKSVMGNHISLVDIKKGNTKEYTQGAKIALDKCLEKNIKIAVLKAKSPSCGKNHIYDGTFSHQLVEGDGIFVQMLKEKGIAVYSENEVTEVLKLINGGK